MLKADDIANILHDKLASGRAKPFQITWLGYDKQRKTAGKVMRMSRAVLVNNSPKHRTIKIAPYGLDAITTVHYDLILFLNDTPTA